MADSYMCLECGEVSHRYEPEEHRNWCSDFKPAIVEVFVRAPAAEQDAAQTRGASLLFCRWRDLERLAPYETRVRRGWGVRW